MTDLTGPRTTGTDAPPDRGLVEVPLRIVATPRAAVPLLWGQRLSWNDSRWMGDDDHYFNLVLTATVPPGRTVPDVLDRVGRLIHRHESLRSLVRVTAEGAPVQDVPATGTVRVIVAPVPHDDVEGAHAVLCERLRGVSFALDEELPVRPLVTTVDAVPRRVSMVLSHVLLDGGAVQVLEDELSTLLSTPHDGLEDALPIPAPQPWERAAAEASEAGRARSAAALRRLERQLHEAPLTPFDGPLRVPDAPRFRRVEMWSPALTEAVRRIAQREGVGSPDVLLGLVGVVLATLLGTTTVLVRTILSNRGFPDLSRLVAAVVSNGLVPVGTTATSFAELVRTVRRTTMGNQLTGQCDPLDRDRLIDRVCAERGADLDLSVLFNDVRDAVDRSAAPRPELDLDDLARATRVAWVGGWERMDATFLFHTASSTDGERVYALVDTCRVPSSTAEALLGGLERLALAVVDDDRALPDLLAAVDLSPTGAT